MSTARPYLSRRLKSGEIAFMPSLRPASVSVGNTPGRSGSVGLPASRTIRVRPMVPGAATFTGPRTGLLIVATSASMASASCTNWSRGSKPR